MRNAISLLAAIALLTGCGQDAADDFRDGYPTAEQVKLEVPEQGTSQSPLGRRESALEGEKAGFYVVTRAVTASVNVGTAAVLGLVTAIAAHPPTSVTGNVAVWGPHTEALSPNTHRFTVTKNANHDYSYVLEGKGKAEPDSAFRAIISGNHKVAVDTSGNKIEHHGNGTFVIDWDAAQELPEHDDNVGQASFEYARLAPGADGTINVEFDQVRDGETGNRVDASYRYLETASAGGSFDFGIIKNLDWAPLRSGLETMTIRSRWTQEGAGRADVRAKGGDLASEATLSECWDTNFLSTYYVVSFDPTNTWGGASACAFATAEFSTLSF